jgi:two-component system, chemotaxis family, chemotaxis protein CheY
MSELASQTSLLFSAPLRVLLVEDDAPFAWALQRYLETQGCRVEHERDGLSALGRLRREPLPELVLLDLALPGVDGWDFAAEVARNTRFPNLPLLVVTCLEEDGRPLPENVVGRVAKPDGPESAEAFFQAVGGQLQRVREARAKCPWGGG